MLQGRRPETEICLWRILFYTSVAVLLPAEEERANAWILLMPLPREEALSNLINSRLCYIVMEDRRNRKKGEGFFTAIFS